MGTLSLAKQIQILLSQTSYFHALFTLHYGLIITVAHEARSFAFFLFQNKFQTGA